MAIRMVIINLLGLPFPEIDSLLGVRSRVELRFIEVESRWPRSFFSRGNTNKTSDMVGMCSGRSVGSIDIQALTRID